MKRVTHAYKDADTVIDVFDHNDNPNSTKAAEREQRENSHDTDVLLHCIYHFSQMSSVSQLWFETGVISPKMNMDLHQYIPVPEICNILFFRNDKCTSSFACHDRM